MADKVKFGIIGTGAIGMRVAKIADAFGCEVVAYSRTVKDVPFIKYMSLDEVMSTSDIISLHCPLTEETYHIIDEAALDKCKKGVVLLNTSRGALVDAEALLNGIK